MSRTYEAMSQIKETIPEFEFDREIELSGVKVKKIIFRNMHTDSTEFIKSDYSEIKTLTVMTFTVGRGFSKAVLNLVKKSTADTKIRIAFNFTNTSNLDKLKQAFKKLLFVDEKPRKLDIMIIANPQTHIKLLQCNEDLLLGSMNHSQTADDLSDFEDKTASPNYRNHELLIQFVAGSILADSIWNKLSMAHRSITKTLNAGNYSDVLDDVYKLTPRETVIESLINKKQVTDASKKASKKIVIEQTYLVISKLLDEELDISIYVGSSLVSLYDHDIQKIYAYFSNDDNHEAIVDSIIGLSRFINPELKTNTYDDLIEVVKDHTNHFLISEIDEEDIKYKVINEGIDEYDGESESESEFGINYEKQVEDIIRELESNNQASFADFIVNLTRAISTYYIDNKLYI